MKLLLLEDDLVLSNEISNFFKQKAFDCAVFYDGMLLIEEYKPVYDIIILDINVPGLNGIEVCKNIRKFDKKTPILMLTALGEIEDKITAFDHGADDYLVKPFHFEELFARANSLLRRKDIPLQENEIIIIDTLVINVSEKKVMRNGLEIQLTPKEYNLLLILATAKGKIVGKLDIADRLWDYHIETNQNTIEVYINFLRKKIDKDHPVKLIHTTIGYGYFLKEE